MTFLLHTFLRLCKSYQRERKRFVLLTGKRTKQGIAPGSARRYSPPPPMAVRRWQKPRRIYVRPRTGPQSAHLWWTAVAKLQAASVPIAQAAAPWDRQTDGQTNVGREQLNKEVDGKPVGEYTRTDGRTTHRHNASNPIYWTDGSIIGKYYTSTSYRSQGGEGIRRVNAALGFTLHTLPVVS